MGTAFTLVLYSVDDATASRASRAAFDRIRSLDRTLTDYDPESELMKLCDRAGGPPVAVGPDLFEVLARSKALHERSEGAFDISIAPVVRLWRRARREKKSPTPNCWTRPCPGRLRRHPARPREADRRVDPSRDEARRRRDRQGVRLGGGDQGPEARGGRFALVAGSGDIVVSDRPPVDRGGRSPSPRSRRRPTGPRAGRSSSRTPRSRPRATPSSSSRSTGSATRTSSTPRPPWA